MLETKNVSLDGTTQSVSIPEDVNRVHIIPNGGAVDIKGLDSGGDNFNLPDGELIELSGRDLRGRTLYFSGTDTNNLCLMYHKTPDIG